MPKLESFEDNPRRALQAELEFHKSWLQAIQKQWSVSTETIAQYRTKVNEVRVKALLLGITLDEQYYNDEETLYEQPYPYAAARPATHE